MAELHSCWPHAAAPAAAWPQEKQTGFCLAPAEEVGLWAVQGGPCARGLCKWVYYTRFVILLIRLICLSWTSLPAGPCQPGQPRLPGKGAAGQLLSAAHTAASPHPAAKPRAGRRHAGKAGMHHMPGDARCCPPYAMQAGRPACLPACQMRTKRSSTVPTVCGAHAATDLLPRPYSTTPQCST